MNIASIVLLNPLVAQTGQSSHSASWALLLFCVILGLMVALNPARRTSEIKRTKA